MATSPPSPDAPLTGSCACGAVRFEVTQPFLGAGYCHCHRCQKRSGSPFGVGAGVAPEGFAITAGADLVEAWHPEDGLPKAFCRACGGHVFGGDPDEGPMVVVRLGAVDGDPGVRPMFHQWVESAPAWAPLPDDGLPRFPRGREA